MEGTGMKITKEMILSKTGGHCAYCGCELSIKTMQIEHAIPRHYALGYDVNLFENLLPACKYCNNYKGDWFIRDFRTHLSKLPQYLFKSTTKAQVAENFGMITLKTWDRIFYYEKIGLKVKEYITDLVKA